MRRSSLQSPVFVDFETFFAALTLHHFEKNIFKPNLWFFVVICWVWLFAPTATEGPSFKHQWLIKSMSKTTWPSVSPICWLFSEICVRRNSIPQILQSSTSQKVILYYPNTSTLHIPFNLYKNIKREVFGTNVLVLDSFLVGLLPRGTSVL